MLVMTHTDEDGKGSNKLSYCLETKELKLFLSLGYFNENLTFKEGTQPPECTDPTLEFDIVERAWVDRSLPDTPVWTEDRARAHFGAV